MDKRETFHSFQDLEASYFKKVAVPEKKDLREKTASSLPPKDDVRDAADEVTLFLEAVSGNIDVSLKNTRYEKKSASPKKKKNSTALAGSASPGPTGADAMGQGTMSPGAMTPGAMGMDAIIRDAMSPCMAATSTKPSHAQAKHPSDDERLFSEAMDGVAPIRSRGRDIAPALKLPSPSVQEVRPQSMDDLFAAKLEFSLEYSEEFVQGHVIGVDPSVIAKMRAGAFSPEAHLDLHGRNLEQAYAALAAFIKYAYQDGKRHLLVITGRGRNSPGGMPVLRERVQSWFTRDPFKRVVLAFCTAKPSDGGAGAVYLLLRKRKKNQGKIVWDRRPSEEELLL